MQAIEQEYEGARLGDTRVENRARVLARGLAERPGDSFPEAFPHESDLEAAYRLLNNDRVTLQKLVEPHVAATIRRARPQRTIVAAHDTTSFRYEGEGREGLGRLLQKGRGFYGHMAIAVTHDDVRDPLGLLGIRTIVRSERRTDKAFDRNAKVRRSDRESLRWAQLVEEVGERCRDVVDVIHVMDREADSFELFERLARGSHRFVIRLAHDRNLEGDGKLQAVLDGASTVVVREVKLSSRVGHSAPSTRKIHPPREERIGRLAISAMQVTLRHRHKAGENLKINIVRVVELEPPPDCEPVEWRLATTEPIDTAEHVTAIVDAYRARWRIEEFFKALKTGCAIEKRQLQRIDALLNALGLFIPIAWSLLRMRVLARQDQPASKVLTKTQTKVLRASSKKPLPSHLSVRSAMFAVAALGGHLKHNGDPGWIVLGRGYERLLVLEQGWLLAKRGKVRKRCDQS